MRSLWLLTAGLLACDPGCDPPGSLDGPTYRMFGNVVEYELGGPEDYPGTSPVNGVTRWAFDWGDAAEGPVTVIIDEQQFAGTGAWGTQECNVFAVRFGGTWVAPGGRRHSFEAAGNFLYFDILLEGALAWDETWEDAGLSGTLDATDAAVSGRQFTN